jgi:hypothetical protein
MCLVVGKMTFHSYAYCNVNRGLLPTRMEDASIANRCMEINPPPPTPQKNTRGQHFISN